MSNTNKTLVRIYLEVCLLLAVCLTIMGFLAPLLISLNDTLGVLSGFFLLLVVPPFAWIFGWHIWTKHIQPLVKGSSNENGKNDGSGGNAGA